MDTEIYNLCFNKLIRRLTSTRWLDKWNIDKTLADDFIHKKSFTDALKSMISNNDYSCTKVLDLCREMMDTLSYPNVQYEWLNYVYEYALSKSFPEAVNIILFDTAAPACEFYLRVLRVICETEKSSECGSFLSKYPLNFLTPEEEKDLEYADEYNKFLKAFTHNYTYEMMKLSEDVFGFNTLEHICGVHSLSMHLARQLKSKGFSVDLGRVSGAAAGHDIGKFGCKASELKRVPNLHYYYTDEWFKRYGINYIRNIAINHSTWDLELENLSLESLILIYSDFRVKNEAAPDGPKIKIYSLQDSFYVILNKLENVDGAKYKRYKKVYAKLKDFEDFLINSGINTDIDSSLKLMPNMADYALLQGNEIVQNLKYAAINQNINVMYELRNEYSLDAILESARSVKDWKMLREYIRQLEEYCTYLTQKQKLQTLKFLYENMMHPEDDIRRHCASLIGIIIAIFDEDYRKEIPENAKIESPSQNSITLLNEYIGSMLFPDHKIIEEHKFYLHYNLSIMIDSFFRHISINNTDVYISTLLNYYESSIWKNTEACMALLQTAKYIPLTDNKDFSKLYDFLNCMYRKRNADIRLLAFETSLELLEKLPENNELTHILCDFLQVSGTISKSPAENFLLNKITVKLGAECNVKIKPFKLNKKQITNIYLSNLKTATDWIKKKIQINILLEYSLKNPQMTGLHTAIHFCNLLKVSAVEIVRNNAGNAILQIVPFLSSSERNELAVELLRALEIEGNKFTEYIPRFTGQVILWLQPDEFDEAIDDFACKMKEADGNLKTLILKTLGFTISHYFKYSKTFKEDSSHFNSRLNKMLGILLNGMADYNYQVKHAAFSVIGKNIFSSDTLSENEKAYILKITAKKILTLLPCGRNNSLSFLTNSTGLNNIYRFISGYTFSNGSLNIPVPAKVAFFPGTFDPFSLSHKEIVRLIRDKGFEVYLAVDEFSWSKKTLPSLLRKNILNMSVADELNVYVFPNSLPINIANSSDLLKLKECFPKSKVYIAAGSDVILNASSYKAPKTENSIYDFPHIIFERGKNKKLNEVLKKINKDTIILTLPAKYGEISSSTIRSYIDANKDISSMVDPMVQQYLYNNGFYQKEPQEKTLLKSLWLDIEMIDASNRNGFEELCSFFKKACKNLRESLLEILQKPSGRIIVLKDSSCSEILGFSAFHWVRSGMLYEETKSAVLSQFLRKHSTGRIVTIDALYIKSGEKSRNLEQIILTETLAFCAGKDYEYALYKNILPCETSETMAELLKMQGFIELPDCSLKEPVFAVDMSTPCVLNLDIENVIKEPFRSNAKVRSVISSSRLRLQKAITGLYPGKLALSFDINIMHQHMIKKICKENNVSTDVLPGKKNGPFMCVPYGDILDRYVIPNTVTKALHTEKYFNPDTASFSIRELPHYLGLANQIKVLKSFDRPVLFVDNILHKGYRMKALDPLIKEENLEVKKIICGILSGRGKDLMDMQKREVSSVYFIPRMKIWFNENALYPFIGGDGLWRGAFSKRNLLSSVNLIMPYTSPVFIKDSTIGAVYNLSEVCIENSLEILKVIEEEYHLLYGRNLSLSSLGVVFTVPRCPDRGNNIEYDLNSSASDYLKNDLELLLRLKNTLTGF